MVRRRRQAETRRLIPRPGRRRPGVGPRVACAARPSYHTASTTAEPGRGRGTGPREEGTMALREYQNVKVEREDGITWVILNRPEKRNCMNPQMHFEMAEILRELETDDETQVMVLTGAGDAWCAGQDLKQFFRELDNDPVGRWRAGQATSEWRFDRLYLFPKPTVAMVNGYCFGGAFTQLFSCDFAIAAEDAIFGLSEVNWGIIPGGIVTKVVADALSYRDALCYIMTGDHFDGKQAAAMRLINYAVPRARLREETVALCNKLKSKNPATVRA